MGSASRIMLIRLVRRHCMPPRKIPNCQGSFPRGYALRGSRHPGYRSVRALQIRVFRLYQLLNMPIFYVHCRGHNINNKRGQDFASYGGWLFAEAIERPTSSCPGGFFVGLAKCSDLGGIYEC